MLVRRQRTGSGGSSLVPAGRNCSYLERDIQDIQDMARLKLEVDVFSGEIQVRGSPPLSHTLSYLVTIRDCYTSSVSHTGSEL